MARKKRKTKASIKQASIKQPRLRYTEDAMQAALEAVGKGVPVAQAARENSVPRITLLNKHRGVYPVSRKMGPECILSDAEESRIVEWLVKMSRAGFPITKNTLLECIRKYLIEKKIQNPFKNDKPGRSWYTSFLRRHPSLTIRTPQNLISTRGAVTKEKVVAWSKEVEQYLTEQGFMDVLKDPKRVFNCDEAAFFLSPKGEKVIVQRTEKSIYRLVNADEKECLTVLMTGSAAGVVAPPLVLFSYERLPRDLINSAPKTWGLGKSSSGWMTHETFFEYVANVFYPWVEQQKIPLPVILFVNGHSSHLSLALSQFCHIKGIILVCFIPNATHLLQPMDVAVFRSLKKAWKEHVTKWRYENDGAEFKKIDFCKLLEKAIEESVTPKILENGFRKCGLVPWDISAVDFTKVPLSINAQNINETREEFNSSTINFFNSFEANIPPETLKIFQDHENSTGWKSNIPVEDHSLFGMWKNLKAVNLPISDSMSPVNPSTPTSEKPNDEIISIASSSINPEILFHSTPASGLSGISVDLTVGDISNILNPEIHTSFSPPSPELSNVQLPSPDEMGLLGIDLGDFSAPLFSDILDGLKASLDTPILDLTLNPNITTKEVANLCSDESKNSPQKSDAESPDAKRSKQAQMPIQDQRESFSPQNKENSPPTKSNPRRQLFPLNTKTPEKSQEVSKPLVLNYQNPNTNASSVCSDNKIKENLPQNAETLEKSPSVTSDSKIKENMVSPFKKVFFFPDKKEKERKRKPKDKVPAVVSGSKWQEFETKKLEEKRLQEEQKQERMRIRTEKREAKIRLQEEKSKVGKRKRQPSKKKIAQVLEAETLGEETDADAPSSEEEENSSNEMALGNFLENSYVIVRYEGEYFPGLVISKKDDGADVKVMAMSGSDWKWPAKEDQLFYENEDIVRTIEPPALKNVRGLYSVPEIKFYRKHFAV